MLSYAIQDGKLSKSAFKEMQLGAYDVKIRWHATSINYHDLLVSNGSIPVQNGRIPMSDGAGVIIAIGDRVSKWQIGDKVMSLFFPDWHDGPPTSENTAHISGESIDGYACAESCISEDVITAIPRGYTYTEAATLPCAGLTAWRALFVEGKINAGQSVLVEGTGGMSIFALQFALAMNCEVYATTSSKSKEAHLSKLGAKYVVNYSEVDKWGKAIYDVSSAGIDHVLDVGGGSTIRNSIDAVKVHGNIYSIGILGSRSGEILFPKLFFKQIHLIGLAVGSRQMQEEMIDFIDKHEIKPIISNTFNLKELNVAFDYQKSQSHFGKIVIEW